MATLSGAMCLTWCKLLMRCKMDTEKKQALERILKSIDSLDSHDRSELILGLITIAGVKDVTYVMLDKGYELGYTSRQYLKEKIEEDGN